MKRAIRAAASTIPYIVFLIVVPLVLLRFIPAELLNALAGGIGIQVQTITTTLALVGISLAALSVLKNLSREESLLKPIASTVGSIVTLYLFLYIIGLGNPLTFGSINIGTAGATILLDLKFIVLLIIVASAVSWNKIDSSQF